MNHVSTPGAIAARRPRPRAALAWSCLALLLALGLVIDGPSLPVGAPLDASAATQSATWLDDAGEILDDIIDDILGKDPAPPTDTPPADDPPSEDDPNW
jgi:hypothetical protein